MPPTLQALAYDELPEGSDVRREYDGAGGVTITAPAGELPPGIRRLLLWDAAVTGAGAGLMMAIPLGILLAYGTRTGRILADPRLRPAALIVLGVFIAGFFLFVWFCEYANKALSFTEARMDATVLHANGTRLLVESFRGETPRSLQLPVTEIQSLAVVREFLTGGPGDRRVPCMKFRLHDGSDIRVLGGRHEAELRWVAGAISDATGVQIVIAEGDSPRLIKSLRRLLVSR